MRRQTHTTRGGFFQPVGALYAHIVLSGLADLPVNTDSRRVDRSGLDRMGQFGDRRWLVHFLKPQAGPGLAGGGVHCTLLDRLFPLWNLLLCRIRLVRRLVGAANVFLQPGVSTLGVSEPETGIFVAHRVASCGFLDGSGRARGRACVSALFSSNCCRTEGRSRLPRVRFAARSSRSTAPSAP